MNRLVSDLLKNGNLKSVIKSIKTNKIPEISIIVEVLRTIAKCISNSQIIIDAEELVCLLQECIKCFKEPLHEKFVEVFLYSLFHIFQCILEKEKYDSIPTLKKYFSDDVVILENFNKNSLANTKIICQYLYNRMVFRYNTEKKGSDSSYLIDLFDLIVYISKTFLDLNFLIKYLYQCQIILVKSEVPVKKLYFYFMENIDYISENLNKNENVNVLSLVKYASYTVSSLVENGEIQNGIECCEKLYKFLSKLSNWSPIKNILKISMYVFKDLPKHINFKKLELNHVLSDAKYKNSIELKELCEFTNLFTHSMYQYVSKNKLNNLTDNVETRSKFCDSILSVMEYLLENLCQPNQCICKHEEFQNYLKALQIPKHFISEGLQTNEFIDMIYQHILKICKILYRLKNKNCLHSKLYWINFSKYLHNISLELHDKDLSSESLKMLKAFLSYDVKFEDETIISQNILIEIFGLLIYNYTKLKKFEKALFIAALLVVNSDNREKALSKWVWVKYLNKDDEIMKITTLPSILENSDKKLEFYYKKKLSDKEFKINLLIDELTCYSKKWYSNVVMMETFQQLCDIAEENTCIHAFVSSFNNYKIIVHLNVFTKVCSILPIYESYVAKTENIEEKLYLALAYFYLHKQKNIYNTLESTDKIKECLKLIDENPHHGDIVSAFECTGLKNNQIKLMDNSLNIFDKLINNDVKLDFKSLNFETLYEVTKELALEYELQCHHRKSHRCWEISLTLSRNFNDNCKQLECLGFMMKLEYSEELEKIGNEIATKIQDVPENIDSVIIYYMNVASACIFQDATKTQNYYEKIQSLVDIEKINNLTIEAGLHFLLSKMYLYNIYATSTSFMVPLKESYYKIFTKRQNADHFSTYDQLVMFEIQEHRIKMFHELGMNRHVKTYGSYHLTLAQSMGLPLRCLNVLYFLTFADLLCNHLDDCQIKISSFSDILSVDQVSWDGSSEKDEVDELAAEIQELDLKKSSSVSSVKKVEYPKFLKHENCRCFCCDNVDYQSQILKKFHLEYLWYAQKGESKASSHLFSLISTFYEKLNRNNVALDEVFGWVLLHRAKYEFGSKQLNVVKEINDRLTPMINVKKQLLPCLFRETLIFNFHLKMSDKFPTSNNMLKNVKSNNLATPVKTPADTDVSLAMKIKPKSVNFDLFNDFNAFKTPKKSTNENFKTPVKKSDFNFKTPAPSFEIFSERIKSTKKKFDMPPSLKKSLLKTPLQERFKKIETPMSNLNFAEVSDIKKTSDFDKLLTPKLPLLKTPLLENKEKKEKPVKAKLNFDLIKNVDIDKPKMQEKVCKKTKSEPLKVLPENDLKEPSSNQDIKVKQIRRKTRKNSPSLSNVNENKDENKRSTRSRTKKP